MEKVTVTDREVLGVKEKVKETSGVTLTDKETHTLNEALKDKKK